MAYESSWIRRIGLHIFMVAYEVKAQIRHIFLNRYGILDIRLAVFKISSYVERRNLFHHKEKKERNIEVVKDGVVPSISVDSGIAVKEVVSPVVVDKTVEKEKQISLADTTLGSYPSLPIQGTTTAGNTPGKSSYANVTGKPSVAPDVNLMKEDVGTILVWVKLHGVPVMAFSEDGLSAIATKLGDYDSEDEVALVDNEMASFLAKKDGYDRANERLLMFQADMLKDGSFDAMTKISSSQVLSKRLLEGRIDTRGCFVQMLFFDNLGELRPNDDISGEDGVRLKERRKIRSEGSARRLYFSENNDEETEQLRASVIFPWTNPDNANFTNWSHQAVNFILGCGLLVLVLSTPVEDKPFKSEFTSFLMKTEVLSGLILNIPRAITISLFTPLNSYDVETEFEVTGFDKACVLPTLGRFSTIGCFSPVIHQPPQELSIQEIEDLKQQYLDELKRLSNLEYRDEEPDNSLSMGDEHLDTIPATESDEFIKSGVETLILIPSESEGIPDHMCDVPFHDNSPPLDVSKDQFEDFSKSNEEFSSTDDDFFSFDKSTMLRHHLPIMSSSAQSDDHSCSDEDVLEKIVSKPLSEEEIIPMESLHTHDFSLLISYKIDSLLEEFTGN
nr:hypothetical protein [Tanacetum cinerariifolium]